MENGIFGVEIIGYYAANACFAVPPPMFEKSITKLFARDETGDTKIITPPFNPADITVFRDSINVLDYRMEISLESFIENFNQEEIDSLFSYLGLLADSIRQVEPLLQQEWGIQTTVPQIKVQAVSSDNFVFVQSNGIVFFMLGDPKNYPNLFASPCALYAHELGHYLNYFNADGKIDDPFVRGSSIASLSNRKYFFNLPFNLFPEELLFDPLGNRHDYSLMVIANQLLAEKAALQICGPEEVGKNVLAGIRTLGKNADPYLLIYFLTLAKELGFEKEERLLTGSVRRGRHPWQAVIPTDELIAKTSYFFRQVSLREPIN